MGEKTGALVKEVDAVKSRAGVWETVDEVVEQLTVEILVGGRDRANGLSGRWIAKRWKVVSQAEENLVVPRDKRRRGL